MLYYYEVLKIQPCASWDEVKDAYRTQIKLWHPDRFVNSDELEQAKADQKMKELNFAFRHLKEHYTRRRTLEIPPDELNIIRQELARPPEVVQAAVVESADLQGHLYQQQNQNSFASAALRGVLVSVAALSLIAVTGFAAQFGFSLAQAKDTLPPLHEGDLYTAVEGNFSSIEGNTERDLFGDGVVPLDSMAPATKPQIIQRAASCDSEAVFGLIRGGTSINAVDEKGDSVLAWAVKKNCYSLSKRLIENGANLKSLSDNGFTPHDWAKWTGNSAMIDLLDDGQLSFLGTRIN